MVCALHATCWHHPLVPALTGSRIHKFAVSAILSLATDKRTLQHRRCVCQQLAGRDVILVHRLLKNTVSEKIGSRAYAVYSDACIQTVGIDPAAQGCRSGARFCGLRGMSALSLNSRGSGN
jgi:hypothetical protein